MQINLVYGPGASSYIARVFQNTGDYFTHTRLLDLSGETIPNILYQFTLNENIGKKIFIAYDDVFLLDILIKHSRATHKKAGLIHPALKHIDCALPNLPVVHIKLYENNPSGINFPIVKGKICRKKELLSFESTFPNAFPYFWLKTL